MKIIKAEIKESKDAYKYQVTIEVSTIDLPKNSGNVDDWRTRVALKVQDAFDSLG